MRKSECGQGQIEFILSILTVMFVIFWTWEVILAVYTYNVLSDAAKEGVRFAAVHGVGNCNCSGPTGGKSCGYQNLSPCPTVVVPPVTCGSTGNTGVSPDPGALNVVDVVKCYAVLSLHDTSGMAVTVNYPQGANASRDQVNVTVSYKYVPFFALPITPTLQVASSGRIDF